MKENHNNECMAGEDKVRGYRDKLEELRQHRTNLICELRSVCSQIADEEVRVALVEVLDR